MKVKTETNGRMKVKNMVVRRSMTENHGSP